MIQPARTNRPLLDEQVFSERLHPRFLLLCRFLGRRHDDVILGLWRSLSEVAALFSPAYLALTQGEASTRSAIYVARLPNGRLRIGAARDVSRVMTSLRHRYGGGGPVALLWAESLDTAALIADEINMLLAGSTVSTISDCSKEVAVRDIQEIAALEVRCLGCYSPAEDDAHP
jgi:hypothetical protein